MIKTIFWDFDGVILDSMPIRDIGFRSIVEGYPKDLVEEFIQYHRYNAGLSRFVKIKYFYNQLLNEEITEEDIQLKAKQFSEIMKRELTDSKFLIKETLDYIKNNYKKYNFHIVSGSENTELNYLCKMLDIDKYFTDVNGSPTHKNDLVKTILEEKHYKPSECILIGDSINDYDAATVNNIEFYGYNNTDLPQSNYIISFKDFNLE